MSSDGFVRVDAMREDDVPRVAAITGATAAEEDRLYEELARPWSRMWVAREEDDGAVAFLIAWHVADELHVLNIATRPDRRRRGMARALLDRSVAYARAHAVRRLLLEVRRSQRRRHLALSVRGILRDELCGFAHYTRRRRCRGDGYSSSIPGIGEILVRDDEVALEPLDASARIRAHAFHG